MRIAPTPLTEADPDPLVQAIVARRGGRFIELDKALLVSPPLAKGWNGFFGALRGELELQPRLRELAMCAVAVLNGADYELGQHAPIFLDEGGKQAQLDALQALGDKAVDSPAFTGADKAALALIVEMTRKVEVSPETFAAAKAALPTERALVELVAVTAAYNMVSRFLVALEV